jgi:hypothetical protein
MNPIRGFPPFAWAKSRQLSDPESPLGSPRGILLGINIRLNRSAQATRDWLRKLFEPDYRPSEKPPITAGTVDMDPNN